MTIPQKDRTPAYVIDERDDEYRVVDVSGRTLLVCRDAHSAEHYAALMNQAFEVGYKAGYRDANDV